MYTLLIILMALSFCSCVVKCELNKTEGADCEWERIKGSCVNSRTCISTLDEKRPAPPVCSQQGKESIICCIDCELINDTSYVVTSPSGGLFWKDGRKARDSCLQYLKDLPHICHQEGYRSGISGFLTSKNIREKCQTYSFWYTGGLPKHLPKPPSEKPYEVLLGFGEDPDTANWLTAGAIISENFILTSATGHITSQGSPSLMYVALNVKDRRHHHVIWHLNTIKKLHLHPGYSGGDTRYDDIALLELVTPISFYEDVLPACLPDLEEEFDIKTAKLMSWKEDFMNSTSFFDKPRTVKAYEVTPEECSKRIKEAELAAPIFLNKLGTQDVDNTTQICYSSDYDLQGTIGSPIVVDSQISRCMNTVVGVTSYSVKGAPTVYTRVSYYLPWIESIVWP